MVKATVATAGQPKLLTDHASRSSEITDQGYVLADTVAGLYSYG